MQVDFAVLRKMMITVLAGGTGSVKLVRGLEFVEWPAIVREHNKTISCQKTESESLSITVSEY